jgi:streptomycin 6-kinase
MEIRDKGDDVRQIANDWAEANLEFAMAIRLIVKQPSGCRDDLHRENIMKRQDTWVITDPTSQI